MLEAHLLIAGLALDPGIEAGSEVGLVLGALEALLALERALQEDLLALESQVVLQILICYGVLGALFGTEDLQGVKLGSENPVDGFLIPSVSA